MPVTFEDSDGILTVHTAVRLESELIEAKEIVEDMILRIFFRVETRLPGGKLVGQAYDDWTRPLILNCKGNPELAEAMRVIQ